MVKIALYLAPEEKHFAGMKQRPAKTFMARVRAILPDLHPTERRLAEAVLDFPGDMAGYSASEIAGLAEVSNATVSRFVRKLGYASFDEARKAVRDEGRMGSALLRFGTGQDGTISTAGRHLDQSRANLDATYGSLASDEIDTLAHALNKARRVWLAGFRAGYPLASYLGWQITQVLPAVSVVPRSGETLAESMANLSTDDVVIVLLLRRNPKIAWTLAETAIDSGAQVALIGDVASMDALPARWHIACTTTSTGPLLNHVSVMAVCNLVAARCLEVSGPSGRKRMGDIEDMHERFAEL
jgi:DNA-binding MurR/RpiR family transcriptional regulator